MADTWNNAVKTLKELTQKYISERTEEPKDAHKTLLLRALVLLKNAHPDTEIMFTPMAKTMVPYAKRPDKKGDREKGLGRHYYCAVNSSGRELKSAEGYYRNGMGKFARGKDFKTFAARSYISTMVAQFVDNMIFALTVSHVFFGWTMKQVLICSITGAVMELLCEIVFSPFGYRMACKWEKENVGSDYLKFKAGQA